MLKSMLLATSVLFAAPAFAQEAPAQDNSQPQQSAPAQDQQVSPATTDAAPPTESAQTAAPETSAPAPAQGVAQTNPATAPASQPAATAQQEPAKQPAATQEQVAQAVGRDFGSYDKDADGKLSQTEFASWMGSLRKASEPSFQPGTPEATGWLNQAFTAADTDKNAAVNKQELTVFLTPKQPS